jgi:hypothetical protein
MTLPAPLEQFPGQATGGTPAPAAPQPAQVVRDALATASPSDVYRAFREARGVVEERLEDLQQRREELVQQLRQGAASDADRQGLDQQLAQLDQQIAQANIQLAEADAQVVAAAAIPGAVVPDPPDDPWRNGPPEEVVMMGIFFTSLLMMPIVIAFARRIWRRSAKVEVTLPPQLAERMESLERSMDAVAIEVERIGEGQRFVTQLLAERAKPGALPAERGGGPGGGRSA